MLRLYVTGTTARSVHAISNARRICDAHYTDDYELEVIDLYQHPEAAREHQIIAAPTLVKIMPGPIRRIIGDLSDEPRALEALGIVQRKSTNRTGKDD
ncbi:MULTISPECIES: circadian clock KaiB family protein [Rhizobium/Agrobacterium group]|uniref:circadian clock KaiB family protein n=1 Tax=Rhizobium/Agrobacterium group TaxID=227290 RepID=UPI000B28CBC7|nr:MULTISPECIES: circadian clock KaiB family protein [Rhizobium/Agrobacterium group]